MYVYVKSEPGLWTVGFYDPSGQWHPDSDYDNREQASERVRYLNGGNNENSSIADTIARNAEASIYTRGH